MRESALKIGFVLALLLLTYNYATDLTSGVSAYYSEGPALDQAMRLVHGESMYPTNLNNPPYTLNLYGPLFAVLQWPFLIGSGPTHVFGNIISVLSHLASAWLAGLIILRLTQKPYARAITSLLVLAMPLVGGSLPLYRVDLLAQALSLAGLYAGLFFKSRKGEILAALLFTAATYTKLTYGLCGPATLFFFQWLQGNRKQAFVQGILIAFMCAVTFGLMQWLTHGGFYINIVIANQIDYSLVRALGNWGTIYPQVFIASLAIPQLWQNKALRPDARRFSSLYLLFAACSAMASGKVGANYGYFSELETALAFMLGITAATAGDSAKVRLTQDWFMWVQLLVCFYFLQSSPYHHYMRKNHADIVALKDKIQAEPGLVLADDYVGLVVLAGKPLYFEPTLMTQLYHTGQWSQDKFVQELRDGKFSMLLLGEYNLRKERWTPEMLKAINERYVLSEKTREAEIWRKR